MPKPEAHIAIDIETYYDGDKEHPNGAMSLRTLSTVQYVRDPRFEFHMASIICPALGIEEPIRCIGDGEMRKFLDALRVAEKSFDLRLVGNNSAFFDALVFKEKFGFYWKKHFDVMTMAGWVYGNRLKSRDLETIAQYMNLPGDPSRLLRAYEALGVPVDAGHKKASAALAAVKGMRLDAIRDNTALLEAYSLYCDIDVTYSWQAFRQLSADVDAHALDVADMHYRAYLEMPLQIDVPLLLNLKDDYVDTRQAEVDAFCATVAATGVTTEGLKTFRSKDKFAKLLVDLGVSESDLPVKQGKNGSIYAFSKADLALESLVAQYGAEGDLIEEAVRLRLEYNSSITESKMRKFALSGATGGWAFHVKPLAAPNTGRHAGGSGTGGSPQNQTRAKPMQYLSCGVGVRWKEKLTIRDIIGVPEGYELVVCDLSGIELRTGMAISDDQKYLDILKDPYNDVYCVTASDIYERTITKSDKGERQMGKLSELSCLGEDTEVLTTRGWVLITEVRADDLLWDGECWVSHDGVVCNGEKPTVNINGIDITPDHLVEDHNGWHEAENADPVSLERWAKRHLPDTQ